MYETSWQHLNPVTTRSRRSFIPGGKNMKYAQDPKCEGHRVGRMHRYGSEGEGEMFSSGRPPCVPVHQRGLDKPSIPENLLKPARKLTSTEQAVSRGFGVTNVVIRS